MSTTTPIQGGRRPSRMARRFRRFLIRSWQAVVVGVVAVALGVLAVLSPGLVQADVRLDEGTVHVARQLDGKLGVLNAQIDELASAVTVGDPQLRLLQDEHVVLAHGVESSKLMEYDPVRNRMGEPVQLPSSATVQLGGATLLVVNPDNGKVWFGSPAEVLDFNFQEQKAHMEVGDFGTATVTSDGDVIGLDVQRSMLVRPDGDEPRETPLPFTLDADAAAVGLSSVGGNAVVLDRQSGRIWVEGMSEAFEVSGAATAELVASAPDALGGVDGARAIYATRAGLIALTDDGPRSLTGNLDATPIRPVQLGDCVYAGFGEQFVRACRDGEVETRDILGVPGGAELSFQVNRTTVVLNDVVSGVVWMVDKDMLRIDDWVRVTPPDDETDDDLAEDDTVVLPERAEENTPPIAQDDELAARAGRSTILEVLDNDTDPDGDVLIISTNSELVGATLETVRGGTGLQVTVDPDTAGPLTFAYRIDDGRGGTATATVTVDVLPADPATANEPPYKHKRAMALDVQLGQSISKRVLLDWRDPDGDSLILVGARLPPGVDDEVSFTPDGEVTYRDIGKTAGEKTVLVTVADGQVEAEGEMLVNVVDDIVPPVAHGDFETAAVGQPVTVYPLANDVGNNLSLMDVEDVDCNCVITRNYPQKRFAFTAQEPGTYYVSYKVSNGPAVTGLVRIDVRGESSNTPPVAALDVALLPPGGGSVMIDPLLNDTDDDGDVLVVQSVSQAPGLQVTLERRHLVTITAQHMPEGPVTLTYRLSDGKHFALGTIVVIPTSATGSPEPQAERDEVKIRAGSTQTVDVLANDTSPVGLDLELESLVENPLGDRAWIDGDRLRVAVPAGRQSGSIGIIYQIRDSEGLVASSTVTITVISEDAENEPPAPRPVVERVLAATTTRLVIPMDGIDPNGDAVRLVGLGSGPTLGRVMAVGDGWLSYEAFPQSKGTDVFTYQVVDALGLVGTGEVRVGVAPAGPDNSDPTGILDEIEVRPGRQVQIPALRNDVDIDGDAINYVSSDPVEIDGVPEVGIIEHRDISFIAPLEPGVYVGTYRIEDSRQGQGTGELQITVSEDAPLLPPEARDDIVPVSAVIGEDWVDVDVTANDLDPDGRPEDLRVEVPDYGAPEGEAATVTSDGRGISARVTQQMQQIRYEVVDPDGLRATGLALVPGRNDSVPVLKDEELELEVVAGETRRIDINSHVSGTAGRSVKLASADNVTETFGSTLPGTERIDYTPDLDYSGPASVVFEVEDAVLEGDETGRRAFISIPIKVLPAPNREGGSNQENVQVANTPPERVGSGDPLLKVGPGEGDARLDLTPLFSDADGDQFVFENFSHASGDKSIDWDVSSDGSRLMARTTIDTLPGTFQVVNAEVVDTNQGRTPFQIRLEVVSSTRPLATLVADTAEARAGHEVSVPVLANDKSNLLDAPTLTVTGTKVISGSGVSKQDGDNVLITPDEGFVGTLTASYTVMDATNDPNRRVDGTIRVTVKDRPSRPGAPRDGVTGNGTVSFTYTPGSPNGYDILSRQAIALSATGAEVRTAECGSTTCTVTGLPNGKPYRFQVTETNEAGTSDRSPESAAYIPDVKPSAPAKPVVQFGDRQLTVSWQPPTWQDPSNPGSPVDRYALELLDGAGTRVGIKERLPAGSTTHTWTGLHNGTNYRFRVVAGNRAGDSPASEMSNAEYPAGPPAAPGTITAVPTENELGGAFEVTFPAAGVANNGDAIREFLVTPVNRSGGDAVASARTVAFTGATSQTVKIEGLGQQHYRFRVQAKNKAGLGAASTTANWQVAWALPTLNNVAASAGDGFIQLVSQDNFGDRPEANPVKEYSLDGGAWRPLPGNGRISGLTNGRSYTVALRVRIDGPRLSAPQEFSGLVPRSAVPVWPEFREGDFHFKGSNGGLVIVLDRMTDRAATGGWDPDGYEYWCEDQCVGNAWTTSNSFNVPGNPPAGTVIGVSIRHRDYREGRTTKYHTLRAPFSASWNSTSRSFSFALNYVSGATCTLSAAGVADGVADFTRTWTQGAGGSSLGTGGITLPVGVTPDTVELACSANNLRETFRISSP